jgi:hypothetical protein
VDERPKHPCCLTVEQDEIDENPDDYDCEACPVRLQLEGLDAENAEAWRIYRKMATRFVQDFALSAELFRIETEGWTVEDVTDLVTRLGIVYDELSPPRPVNG